jgi:hypothetical protein
MRLWQFILALITVTYSASSIRSQTIERKDLPYFFGTLPTADSGKGDKLELTEFTEWYISPVKDESRLDSFCHKAEHPIEYSWYTCVEPAPEFDWAPRTEGPIAQLGQYVYVILKDLCGHEEERNILSVWQEVDSTHLTLKAINQYRFESMFGRATIRRIMPFPDSSLVLHAWVYSADVGWEDGRDIFLRSRDSCHFEPFYEVSWTSMDSLRSFVSVDHLGLPSYKILSITEHLSKPRYGEYSTFPEQEVIDFDELWILDSATTEVIDLWHLAVQKFGIDTTKISHNH